MRSNRQKNLSFMVDVKQKTGKYEYRKDIRKALSYVRGSVEEACQSMEHLD